MLNHITIAVNPQQLAILMNQQNSTHGATRLVVATNNGEFRAMTPADVFASRGSYLVHQVAQPSGIVIHQPSGIVIHQPSGPGQRHYCSICKNSNSDHRRRDCPLKECKAPGCTKCGPGQRHYCSICKNSNSDHRRRNCPFNLSFGPIKLCKAPGCTKCGPGQRHYCRNCKSRDSDHLSRNCHLR